MRADGAPTVAKPPTTATPAHARATARAVVAHAERLELDERRPALQRRLGRGGRPRGAAARPRGRARVSAVDVERDIAARRCARDDDVRPLAGPERGGARLGAGPARVRDSAARARGAQPRGVGKSRVSARDKPVAALLAAPRRVARRLVFEARALALDIVAVDAVIVVVVVAFLSPNERAVGRHGEIGARAHDRPRDRVAFGAARDGGGDRARQQRPQRREEHLALGELPRVVGLTVALALRARGRPHPQGYGERGRVVARAVAVALAGRGRRWLCGDRDDEAAVLVRPDRDAADERAARVGLAARVGRGRGRGGRVERAFRELEQRARERARRRRAPQQPRGDRARGRAQRGRVGGRGRRVRRPPLRLPAVAGRALGVGAVARGLVQRAR